MNSNKINYTELSPDNPNTIVFLHSEYLSSWIWKKQKDYFDNSINISGNNNNNNSYNCLFIDLPEHGKNVFGEDFSIENSANIIASFLKDFIANKNKKTAENATNINIVAMGVGGQIAIEILAKNHDLINKIMVSGVYLASNNVDNELTNIIQNTAIINYWKIKKHNDFLVKAYLRHYNISKKYMEDLKYSNDKINKNSLVNIMSEINNFKIPNSIGNNRNNKNKNNNKGNNNNSPKISLYFGLKESENILKSAFRIDKIIKLNNFCAIKKAVHLWNFTNSDLFNKIIEHEFRNNNNNNKSNSNNNDNDNSNNNLDKKYKEEIECFG
ncbi:MAG: hypothetical protein ACRCVG_02390 [Methanobacteriaceae archaeon]